MNMKLKICLILVLIVSLSLVSYGNVEEEVEVGNEEAFSDEEPIKRTNVLLGGRTKLSPDNEIIPDLISLINEVRFNSTGEDENVWYVAEAGDVYSQIVSGVRYTLDVQLNKTNCLKKTLMAKEVTVDELKTELEKIPSLCEAVGVDEAQNESVSVRYTIWSQPWTNKFEVMSEEQL